ncbi:MAG: MFS transporter [Rhizobiaceae bacterium]|nr:MFS transporter [Rhizobiaceae bacterium]MCV0408723.1 MFS transporter [Rhizobiaceae bacterium]
MHAPSDTRSSNHARRAVAAMFFANGFVVGSWAPQIPLLLTRLDISETVLGLLILLFGLGALIAMPACGIIMARTGSRPALTGFGVATSVALLLVALAPDAWMAAPAMIVFGGAVGGMDVAMNTNAVAVEKRLKRAIMSSSHGFWSLGGFAGGGLGGGAILVFGHLAHAGLVTAATLAMVLTALPFVIADAAQDSPAEGTVPRGLPRRPAIYLIGLLALFCMLPEGAVLDWAALHLRQALGADIATAGFAFALFSGAMATMRFAGDAVRDRFGAVDTLRGSALIAAGGMLAAALAPTPWLAIAAFAAAGFGIANTVPIAFSAAGAQPGISSSTGMSVATTMGYSGILAAPSAIGFIGERTGFAPVFAGLAGLLLIVALMAPLASAADSARRV